MITVVFSEQTFVISKKKKNLWLRGDMIGEIFFKEKFLKIVENLLSVY